MKNFIEDFLIEEDIDEIENDQHLLHIKKLIKLLEKDRAQQLILSGVSKRLKDYANWIGKNEFTMFADGNWSDVFGNDFTNDKLYNMYLKSKN